MKGTRESPSLAAVAVTDIGGAPPDINATFAMKSQSCLLSVAIPTISIRVNELIVKGTNPHQVITMTQSVLLDNSY